MRLDFVDGDDWQGLYLDWTLISEGHTVQWRLWVMWRLIEDGRPILEFREHEVDLSQWGRCPPRFEELGLGRA